MLEIFAYRGETVMHFTDQNRISKIVYCIRYVMVCKLVLQTQTQKSNGGRQKQRNFDISSPYSRRHN